MELLLEQLPFQDHAVRAVVDAFEGQSRNTFDNSYFLELQSNVSDLTPEQFAENLRAIAAANGVPTDIARFSEAVDVCIEMETGTGKTLVYIRTIFELHRRHGFSKFIILVPSVAIREGVMTTLDMFGPQLERFYGVRIPAFEYISRKLPQVRDFVSNPQPQVMVMTLQSFTQDENVVNRPGRDDAVLGLSYLDAIGKTRPIVIMDEPQEGMDTENAKRRLRVRRAEETDATPTLNPFVRLRYSATHRPTETRNLVYRLTPPVAYAAGLVKKIEVLSVAEKSDEATLKLEFAEVQVGAGDPKVKLKAWRLRVAGDFGWSDTPWLKAGDSLAEKTRNPSYADFVIEKIHKCMGDGTWRVRFTNGVELTQGDRSGDRLGIFRQQLHWLIRRHYQKALGLGHTGERLGPGLKERGIKGLSLVFIDRVEKYAAPDGPIRQIFEEEYRALRREYLGTEPTAAEIAAAQGSYFAQNGRGEFTDSVAMQNNKQAIDDILRSKTALLALDHPVEFIFSHSALGVGWDNPNVFNIATLNFSYSEAKKRQEIGRGLRICRDQHGQRVPDAEGTPEGREINLLTIIPNETYETFARDYQAQIREDYGEPGMAPKLRHTHKGRPCARTIRRRDDLFQSEAFRGFWARLARKTRYTVIFDEAELVRRCVAAMAAIVVPEYRAEVALDRVTRLSASGLEREHLGSEQVALAATFAPLDLLEELSEATGLAYRTTRELLIRLEPAARSELVKNPARWLQAAGQRIQHIEREEMLRVLRYEPTEETVPLDVFPASFLSFDPDLTPTPRVGLYDHIEWDSGVEATFAREADRDIKVVCLVKLPAAYKIPVPGHRDGFSPDWGLVLQKTSLREGDDESYEFVVETKGTDDENDPRALSDDERWKIRCARKHFAALGVPANFVAPVKTWQSFLEKSGLL